MGELLCKCAVVATECEQGMCRSACVELVKLKAAVVRYSSALALKGQTARSEKLGSVTKEHFFHCNTTPSLIVSNFLLKKICSELLQRRQNSAVLCCWHHCR